MLRGNKNLTGALTGITAAVVGVVLNLALVFGAAIAAFSKTVAFGWLYGVDLWVLRTAQEHSSGLLTRQRASSRSSAARRSRGWRCSQGSFGAAAGCCRARSSRHSWRRG